mgnify:FL=1|jgi:5'-deoxynucleotidase YfbR-like HD superfamily hydrolase
MLEKFSNDEIEKEYVLAKTLRYNNRTHLQEESVAEHSFFVALFSLKIVQALKLPEELELRILRLAVLHDCAESITSDIPHNVKKLYPDFASFLKTVEDQYYSKHWSYFKDKLNDEIAEAVVKLADNYSVLQFCINEQRLGNTSPDIMEIFVNANQRVDTSIDKVNRLLKEANYL